jgi:hypothetical protein
MDPIGSVLVKVPDLSTKLEFPIEFTARAHRVEESFAFSLFVKRRQDKKAKAANCSPKTLTTLSVPDHLSSKYSPNFFVLELLRLTESTKTEKYIRMRVLDETQLALMQNQKLIQGVYQEGVWTSWHLIGQDNLLQEKILLYLGETGRMSLLFEIRTFKKNACVTCSFGILKIADDSGLVLNTNSVTQVPITKLQKRQREVDLQELQRELHTKKKPFGVLHLTCHLQSSKFTSDPATHDVLSLKPFQRKLSLTKELMLITDQIFATIWRNISQPNAVQSLLRLLELYEISNEAYRAKCDRILRKRFCPKFYQAILKFMCQTDLAKEVKEVMCCSMPYIFENFARLMPTAEIEDETEMIMETLFTRLGLLVQDSELKMCSRQRICRAVPSLREMAEFFFEEEEATRMFLEFVEKIDSKDEKNYALIAELVSQMNQNRFFRKKENFTKVFPSVITKLSLFASDESKKSVFSVVREFYFLLKELDLKEFYEDLLEFLQKSVHFVQISISGFCF